MIKKRPLKSNKKDALLEGTEYEMNKLRSKRLELYQLLYEHAEGDKGTITKMYNNLYELYLLKTKNNLPRLAQTAGYSRVVEYADKHGHLENIIEIAKKLYMKASCEERKHD